eukprot:6188926-Pleurochrysis_carterae.AAC.4
MHSSDASRLRRASQRGPFTAPQRRAAPRLLGREKRAGSWGQLVVGLDRDKRRAVVVAHGVSPRVAEAHDGDSYKQDEADEKGGDGNCDGMRAGDRGHGETSIEAHA